MRVSFRLLGSSIVSLVGLVFLSAGAGCSDSGAEDPAVPSGTGAVESEQVGWSCVGSHSKKKASDARYYATSFGCYTSDAGKLMKDPGDNCLPGCPNIIGSALCPQAKTGPACEATIKWFAADAGRFGCGKRLEVTNPANGKKLVVAAIDYGPSCKVEAKVKHAALDLSYPSTWYLFKGQQGVVNRAAVTVVEVSATTPLGPVKTNPDSIDDPSDDPPADRGEGVETADVEVDDEGRPLASEPSDETEPLSCEAIGAAGVCDGDTLHTCADDGPVTTRCTEIGQRCGADPERAGYATCLPVK